MRSLDDLSDRPRQHSLLPPTRKRYDLDEGEPGYYTDISTGKIGESDDAWLCTFEAVIARELYAHLFRGLSRESAEIMCDLKEGNPQIGFRGDIHQPVCWEELHNLQLQSELTETWYND